MRKETVLWQSRSSVTIFNLCVLKHWLLGFSSFREKEKNQMWGLCGWFCQITEQSWIQSATSFLFKKFPFLVNTEWEPIKRSLKKTGFYFIRQRSSVSPSLVSRVFPLCFSFSGWLLLCCLCWFEGRVGPWGWGLTAAPCRPAQSPWACSWQQLGSASRPPHPPSEGSAHQWKKLSAPHYFYNLSEFAD